MENLKVVYLFEQTNGNITLKKQLQYIGFLLKRYCVFVAIVICFNAFSQAPSQPQFPTYGNLNVNNASGQSSPYYYQKTTQATQVGTNNSNSFNPQILNNWDKMSVTEQNRVVMQIHGMKPPPSDEQIKADYENLRNFKQNNSKNKEQGNYEKLAEVLNEVQEVDNNILPETSNIQVLQDYQNAYNKISEMLNGKSKLSFINALYIQETAFGNSYLTHDEYYQTLKQSAEFIKQWVTQQNAPLTPDNLHYAIQQFMGDTISIKVLTDDKKGSKTITHYPFKYDYEDYEGKKDYRNYFATKCLATGTGQCSSMPDVYLLLCEMLGIKGYKTFAPMHSFVKYKSVQGTIINYEPTSHWNLSDKWYQENMGVTSKAKINGIYLDTLNRKQCVANTLVDLAINYMFKTKNPDTTFVLKCLNTSNKYLPKHKNLYGHLAKSSLLARQLHLSLVKHGVKDISQISNFPDTNYLYQQLQKNEEYLSSLGYQEMSKEIYEDMLRQQNNKTNAPNAKIKKSLFQTN